MQLKNISWGIVIDEITEIDGAWQQNGKKTAQIEITFM